jgi:hypothetical protein
LGQKEKDRSAINTSLANILAEVQTANKTKDELTRDKQAKLREIDCMSHISNLISPGFSGLPDVSTIILSHYKKNQSGVD